MFFVAFVIGVIIGLIITFVGSSYYNFLTSSNKIVYSMMNGTIDSSVLFWEKLLVFIVPVILFFLLSLNYYSSFIQLLFLTYQSALLVLSCSALILTYGFSGFLNVIFITVPINLLYFFVLMFFGVTNISRSKMAFKYKNFAEGFDYVYLFKTLSVVIAIVLISFSACVIYPLVLRNINFIIF